MQNEARPIARPSRHPIHPHPERCPSCGHDGHATGRCQSEVIPARDPFNAAAMNGPRHLRCGECQHTADLPVGYKPFAAPGNANPPEDYVAWTRAREAS